MPAAKNPGGNVGKGRKKGSRNKRTLKLKEKLDEWGCDPAQILADFANGKETDDIELQAKCAQSLMQYAYPRLSASSVDLKASDMPSVKIEYVTPKAALKYVKPKKK